MDSEDEREMETESKEKYYSPPGPPYLRHLHRKKELDMKKAFYCEKMDRGDSDEPAKDYSVVYRLDRFFDSMIGFHTGKLDLTGRHQRRYISLASRWNRFMLGLSELSRHAQKHDNFMRRNDGSLILREGKPWPIVEWTTQEDIWQKFNDQWCLHNQIPLEFLFGGTDKVLECLVESPLPRFQKLLLSDLPPEIIYEIMDVDGVEVARTLGAASQGFRRLSLQSIYKTRSFIIQHNWKISRPEDRAEAIAAERDRIHKARAAVLEDAAFCLARSDILAGMREIDLGNGWSPMFDEAVEEPAIFWKPFLATLANVLQHTPNIEKLKTYDMPVDLNLLASVVTRSHLYTFQSFNGISPIWETVLDLPQALSVLNVHLTMTKEPSFSMWNVLVLFPNLLVLTVSASDYFFLPRPDIRARLPIFTTLRRVFLDRIHIEEVDALCEWIQACKAGSALQLTHFKIQTTYGLFRDQIVALLDALSSAPMEILVLEGLIYVGGDVFQSIAQTFPGLRALTLVYRQNVSQQRTDAADWPYPSWELAQHLAVFPSLKHFGCNFRVPMIDASPCMMLALEQDFATDLEWRREDDCYFIDDYVVPRIWAVHCPTLETAAVIERSTRGFRISREDGQVQVVHGGEWWADWDIGRYHPDRMFAGPRRWPDILPSGNV